MEMHERQQFEFLLHTAVERYVERIEQRCEGPHAALAALTRDRNSEGIWMTEFIDAIFEDFLLANAAGASFVMCALARRTTSELSSKPGETVEAFLVRSAKTVFADLFFAKTMEHLEQHASFETLDVKTGFEAGERTHQI